MLSFASPTLRSPLIKHAVRHTQVRHATLIRRPKRPYTFTQLITLSDGSTFTHRTTSPQPVYHAGKDTRNSALWNPSSQKLMNVEEDEAGRLRRFRARFGRGFDAEAKVIEDPDDADKTKQQKQSGQQPEQADAESDENLMDLISSYSSAQPNAPKKQKGKK